MLARLLHDLYSRLLIVGLVTLAIASVISTVPGNASTAAAMSHPGRASRTTLQLPQASSVHKTASVRIYLVAIGDNGRSGKKIGCGDSLVAVNRPVAPTTTPLATAMRLLLSDHRRYYGRSELYNALYQSRLRLQRAAVVNGKATIYLIGTMQLGGVCDDPRVGAQLRQTVRQFPTVHSVAIFVNNVPLWRRLSEKG